MSQVVSVTVSASITVVDPLTQLPLGGRLTSLNWKFREDFYSAVRRTLCSPAGVEAPDTAASDEAPRA